MPCRELCHFARASIVSMTRPKIRTLCFARVAFDLDSLSFGWGGPSSSMHQPVTSLRIDPSHPTNSIKALKHKSKALQSRPPYQPWTRSISIKQSIAFKSVLIHSAALAMPSLRSISRSSVHARRPTLSSSACPSGDSPSMLSIHHTPCPRAPKSLVDLEVQAELKCYHNFYTKLFCLVKNHFLLKIH